MCSLGSTTVTYIIDHPCVDGLDVTVTYIITWFHPIYDTILRRLCHGFESNL